MSDDSSDVLGGCLGALLVVLLKLWAIKWIYEFIVAWYTTGIVPTFWSFVWATFLVLFVIAPASSSSSKSK